MAQKEAELYASCMEDLANPALLDDAERAHLKAKSVALCGMTLRDYFAAKIMQAMLTRLTYDDRMPEAAYQRADAMLKAREQ
jgi:hypothetical protein